MTLRFDLVAHDVLPDLFAAMFVVDHADFSHVLMAYDYDRQRDWPRQRSHFAFGKPVDGWRLAVEVHAFGAYDPLTDTPTELEVVHASVEPVEERFQPLPLVLRGQVRSHRNENLRLSHDSKSKRFEPPLNIGNTGPRVSTPPPSLPTVGVTKKAVKQALELVNEVVESDERSRDHLRWWYRMPRPPQVEQPRGRASRSPREWAELAKIYVTYAESNSDKTIHYIAEDFGQNRQYWSRLFVYVADAGYIEGRSRGMAGGRLSQRAQDELNAHVRPDGDES